MNATGPASTRRLRVDVWSDLSDPACQVGKRRLEQAVGEFEHPGEVLVCHHACGVGPGAEQPEHELARPPAFDAQRMCELGLHQGGPALQSAVVERLMSARLDEGRDIDDADTLQRLGAEAGLDEQHLAALLAGQEYAEQVRADLALAQQYGVTDPPYVLINDVAAPAGELTVDHLVGLLQRAWRGLGG